MSYAPSPPYDGNCYLMHYPALSDYLPTECHYNVSIDDSSSFSTTSPPIINTIRPVYSDHDQLRLFRNVPVDSGHAHLFVPQKVYRPHSNRDWSKYVEEVELKESIKFLSDDKAIHGRELKKKTGDRRQKTERRRAAGTVRSPVSPALHIDRELSRNTPGRGG